MPLPGSKDPAAWQAERGGPCPHHPGPARCSLSAVGHTCALGTAPPQLPCSLRLPWSPFKVPGLLWLPWDDQLSDSSTVKVLFRSLRLLETGFSWFRSPHIKALQQRSHTQTRGETHTCTHTRMADCFSVITSDFFPWQHRGMV